MWKGGGKKAEFFHFTVFGMFYNISNISILQTPCDICIYVTAIWKYEDINSELPASTFQRKQTPQEWPQSKKIGLEGQ